MPVSTYSDISTLVGNVYSIALQAAYEADIMSPLVTVWSNKSDSQPRIWATYSGGTFAVTAETADLSSQAFTPTVAGTATPVTYAQQIVLSERRLSTDPMGAQREAGNYLGFKGGEHVDTTLVGVFSSLTGGTVGTAGGTLTWTNIMRASAYLRTNKVRMPYFAVLHPVQWYYLTSGTAVPTLLQTEAFANSVLAPFYQGSYSGINFFVDANITSGTAAVGGMFGREAIYLDMRNPLTINPQWDASIGGSGAWELNAFMEYVGGVYRPTYGAQLIGTSS